MCSVRAAALTNYAEVARQVGLDPYAMLRSSEIDACVLTDREMRLSATKVAHLLEASAETSGCQDFGLRIAEKRSTSNLGAVGLLLSHQPSLRSALETLVQHRNLLNSALALQIKDEGDLVIIREELVVDGPKVQSYELAVAVMTLLVASILGPGWRPVSTHFTHAKPKGLTLHRKFFGEHVEFGSEFNGLVCLKSDMDRPNTAADPNVARYAAQLVNSLHGMGQITFSHEVRKAAYLLLPVGDASIVGIARSLGLNQRTLQRRLEAEGAEFSDLVKEIRRELAVRYIRDTSHSLTRVAGLLGYGQLSSFTRWFVGEFGVAPSAWRCRTGHAGSSRTGDYRSLAADDRESVSGEGQVSRASENVNAQSLSTTVHP